MVGLKSNKARHYLCLRQNAAAMRSQALKNPTLRFPLLLPEELSSSPETFSGFFFKEYTSSKVVCGCTAHQDNYKIRRENYFLLIPCKEIGLNEFLNFLLNFLSR